MAEAPDQSKGAHTRPQQPENLFVRSATLLSTEECGRRLGLADWFQRMRQDEAPDWYFTVSKFSAFLVITEQKIWEYLGAAENINHQGLDLLLDHLAAAARYFVSAHNEDDDPCDDDEFGDSSPVPGFTTPVDSAEHTNTSERPAKRIRTLDRSSDWPWEKAGDALSSGRESSLCTISIPNDPKPASIVPFGWSMSTGRLRYSQVLAHSICQGFDISPHTVSYLCHEIGCLHESWNRILMDPQLASFWHNGHFGLRHVGQLPGNRPDNPIVPVELELVWLPRSQSAWSSGWQGVLQDPDIIPVNLEEERAAFFQGLLSVGSFSLTATGRGQILTEHPSPDRETLAVRMPLSEARLFTMTVDVQWSLIRIAALSGHADAAEHGWREEEPIIPLFFWEEDEPAPLTDVEMIERILNWINEVVDGEPEEQ